MSIELSLVVPVFNEAEAIPIFLKTVRPILEGCADTFEIIFVNDGSTDDTANIIVDRASSDSRIKMVDLSRNFGKEIALSAGLQYSSGNAVVPIDVDLQDPPELIPEMLSQWRAGYDVVLAKRSDRLADTRAKRYASGLFYIAIRKMSDIEIPANVGDFRLMSRQVVDALLQFPERERFMKGLFAWLGFHQTVVHFSRPHRAAGTTKWKPIRLWRLAVEGIVSFSTLPLKLWSYLGLFCAIAGLSYGLIVAVRAYLFGNEVPGYASMATFLLCFNGITLLGLGVIGEYIARIFIEVKGRPLFLVRQTHGFSPGQGMPFRQSAVPAPHPAAQGEQGLP